LPRVPATDTELMIVYNTTIKVDNVVANEWVHWQKEIFIPAMLGTGLFYDHRFFELLGQDDNDGKTFIVQYFSIAVSDYDNYRQYHATEFYRMQQAKWANQYVEFSTIMQAVQ
jgi:Domain of unknown function (DUF4286)